MFVLNLLQSASVNPVGGGHNCMVASVLPESTRVSGGSKVTLATEPWWPCKGPPIGWYVVASHNRNVLSLLPATIHRPLCEKATLSTGLGHR